MVNRFAAASSPASPALEESGRVPAFPAVKGGEVRPATGSSCQRRQPGLVVRSRPWAARYKGVVGWVGGGGGLPVGQQGPHSVDSVAHRGGVMRAGDRGRRRQSRRRWRRRVWTLVAWVLVLAGLLWGCRGRRRDGGKAEVEWAEEEDEGEECREERRGCGQEEVLAGTEWLLEEYRRTDFGELGRRIRAIGEVVERLEEQCGTTECVGGHETLGLIEGKYFPWISQDERFPGRSILGLLKKERARKGRAGGSRGIVVCAGNQHVAFIQTLIRSIREGFGCTLPIEIVYNGPKDLSEENCRRMQIVADGVSCKDIFSVFHPSILPLRHWDVKPFSILASNFAEVLLFDADSAFLQSPDSLFENELYQKTGALFFHDRTMTFGSFRIRDLLFELTSGGKLMSEFARSSRTFRNETIHEQESGLVLIDKSKRSALLGLIAACKLLDVTERSYYYNLAHGDKESFWLGFESAGQPYSFMPWYPGAIGFSHSIFSRACGRLLHFDEQGKPLWWNGGYKNSERHYFRYKYLPLIDMNVYDDGGRSEERPNTGLWDMDLIHMFCITQSSRKVRKLPVDARKNSQFVIKSFERFDSMMRDDVKKAQRVWIPLFSQDFLDDIP